jgi:TolA-binding protein
MKPEIGNSASKLLLLVLALLSMVMLIRAPAFAAEEESLYIQGNASIMQCQWDKAIEDFSELLRKYPGTRFVDASFWIGYCLNEKGNYMQAIEKFRSFATKYPQNSYSSQALYKIGEIYEKNLSDYNKAIDAYNVVERKFPASQAAVQSIVNRSNLTESLGNNFGQAQDGYGKVIRMVTERKDIYQGYKDMAQQRVTFITANSDFGYKPLKIYNQAMAFEEHNRMEKAYECYIALIGTYPKSTLADNSSFRIVKYWEKKGLIPKVKEEGKKFLSTYPQSEFAPQVRAILQKYGE